MYGSMGGFYNLPSAPGGSSNAVQATAFATNNGPSAFSPIVPLHSAGIAAGNAFGMQRQPSDAWNVRAKFPFYSAAPKDMHARC
jgi:hypothetical protein